MAVSRRDIFDCVWSDVIVSDGALSQAVRTLRRTLGDDSREPAFIRTVSRHGYSFVFPDVVEESEDVQPAAADLRTLAAQPDGTRPRPTADELIERLLRPFNRAGGIDEDQRDAAEQLHLLGTAHALDRLRMTPGHARALAVLRDARWDAPGAGAVPLIGDPEGLAAAWILVGLRARQAFRVAGRRWGGAAAGGAAAGALAGISGGLALVVAPASQASPTAMVALAAIGAVAGAVGASGIAAGIAAAEVLARSRRQAAIVAGGVVGGFVVGVIAQAIVRWTLEGLFGLRLPVVGGPIEGVMLGGAVGLGYSAATRRPEGGMATPAGRARWATALTVAACCVAAGILLSWFERPLVGGLVNAIAQASRGSQLGLAPLGSLVGDPSFGPMTQMLLAVLECGLFGLGLASGLTRRPIAD